METTVRETEPEVIKMEPIVKTYYDALENGKIIGRKCKRCGAVEFPPVITCNTCTCGETEWVEISGEGMMTDFVLESILSKRPGMEDLSPFALACVKLKEGPWFNTVVCGVTKKNKAELLKKLPLPVKARIIQRDGYKTVVFDLA
jgi:uncharacterized OB-fold protein